jgi:hypothetical protein
MSKIALSLGAAAIIGAVAGTASLSLDKGGRAQLAEGAKRVAVATGMVRAREPQPGDYWEGCNSTRDAGTAPIYASEPGYREEMDGDGDGIACEPIR